MNALHLTIFPGMQVQAFWSIDSLVFDIPPYLNPLCLTIYTITLNLLFLTLYDTKRFILLRYIISLFSNQKYRYPPN